MNEVLAQLKEAILACNPKGAKDLTAKAIEGGTDALSIANITIEAIRSVGDRFGRGEAWLPDLIGSADAMKAAMSVIEEELKRTGKKRQGLGSIVIGTVYGDIHSIGKDMVATLATAEGFQIIDLGIDIKGDVFADAVREHKPEILAMSSLLTTTAPEQDKVIKILKHEGLREKVKVVVGGGAITANFAKSIGADGYSPTAPMGIKLFRELLGKGA